MTSLPDLWKPSEQEQFDGPALIDTHIWIWYLDGAAALMSADAVRMLKRCVRARGLRVSDISVWEIGTKASKGRLTLLPSLSTWLERAGKRPGFSFLPLDREILLRSTQLPGAVHGDPADRMLIASASLAHLPLVTADRAIIEYVRSEGGFSVCDARP